MINKLSGWNKKLIQPLAVSTVEMTKRLKHTITLLSIKHLKNIKHKRAHFAQTQHNNYEAASHSTSPTLGLNTFHTSSSIRH